MCKFYFVLSKELAEDRSFDRSFIVETAHRTQIASTAFREWLFGDTISLGGAYPVTTENSALVYLQSECPCAT
jgi:hypothetical protein